MTNQSSTSQSSWEQFGGDVPAPATCVVHRNEPHDIYIGRADGVDAHLNNTSPREPGWLSNSYRIGEHGDVHTREQSLALYCRDLLSCVGSNSAFVAALAQLKGQRLACYCRHSRETDPACHDDILVDVVDTLQPVGTDSNSEASDV